MIHGVTCHTVEAVVGDPHPALLDASISRSIIVAAEKGTSCEAHLMTIRHQMPISETLETNNIAAWGVRG
jgi:hypothetical protein